MRVPAALAGRRARSSAALAAALLVALTGCSGEPDQQAPPTTINVGMMPVVDTAAFNLALDRGYFRDAGLDVRTQRIPGGEASVPLLQQGRLDVSFGNWPSFLNAQATGRADLKLVADAYQATNGMMLLQTMPHRVRRVEDLRGKTIALNTRDNIMELITRSVLETHGVPQDSVKFRTMPFPQIPEALKNGEVDAATLNEPYISQANRLGAVTLADAATGPTVDIPIAGYAANSQFAAQHPDAMAKFREVMQRASTEANADRATVEKELPKYSTVDPTTAQLVRIGRYPTSIDVRRLGRVEDLMTRYHALPPDKNVDVPAMVFQPPQPPGR
ncbi:MAG: ABC transporter substrate-binding protein [Saccharopolyspora rectivirgula]